MFAPSFYLPIFFNDSAMLLLATTKLENRLSCINSRQTSPYPTRTPLRNAWACLAALVRNSAATWSKRCRPSRHIACSTKLQPMHEKPGGSSKAPTKVLTLPSAIAPSRYPASNARGACRHLRQKSCPCHCLRLQSRKRPRPADSLPAT